MRIPLLVAVLLLVGCDTKEKIYARYEGEVIRANIAYSGSDAESAYQERLRLLEYIKKLQADNASISIPYEDIYIWENARFGLLAEHLGKREESSHYFRLAVAYAKKRFKRDSEIPATEAGLRSALDIMDTPDKIAWRQR